MGMPWTPAETSLLTDRYPLEGSLTISRDIGRSPDSVTSQARRYGCTAMFVHRRQAETRVRRSRTVNPEFFERKGPDVAFVLGVVWACGTVKETHRLALRLAVRRERSDVLRRVQELMASRHSIQTYPETSVLEISNSLLVRSLLAGYGLPPRSAKDPKPPLINDEMLPPFAAGHLAATSHQSAEYIHWNGSTNVMEWLSQGIQTQAHVTEPKVLVRNYRERMIRWRDEADVRAIRGWLGVSD